MPANGQPANDQLKTLAKGAPSTDARKRDIASCLRSVYVQKLNNRPHFPLDKDPELDR